jgi:hypothetical protein
LHRKTAVVVKGTKWLYHFLVDLRATFPVGASVGDLFESVCEKDGQEAIHIAKKASAMAWNEIQEFPKGRCWSEAIAVGSLAFAEKVKRASPGRSRQKA